MKERFRIVITAVRIYMEYKDILYYLHFTIAVFITFFNDFFFKKSKFSLNLNIISN